MKIVISIGGSVLTKGKSPEIFGKYVKVIKKLQAAGYRLAVVCGGGKPARENMAIARKFKVSSKQLDFIGIAATHLNASTFAACLGKSGYLVKWKKLSSALKEVKKNFGQKIIVAGGYDVGTSSDYDAASIAKVVKADLLINVTNIDGIYSADPKKNPRAKRFKRLTHGKFLQIISKNPQKPGEYRLFDLPAAKLIKKLKLKMIFISGKNSEELYRAVKGAHAGTTVE